MHLLSQGRKLYGKPRILIVEDNDDQWFIIRWALGQRFSEVDPIRAATASEAVTYLDECSAGLRPLPKLVLIDLYLPSRQTGLDLLQQIKRHPTYQAIPVIILSQSDRTNDICQSYRLRSSAYLVKPIAPEQWLQCFARVRRAWWGIVMLSTN